MENLLNNAYFWQKIDTLYSSSKFNVAYEAGQAHKVFRNLVYPVQYGFLADLVDDKDLGIAVFKGSSLSKVQSIIISADVFKKDIEPKLLVGCTEQEEHEILCFLNQTDLQKTILVRRGNDLPSWANTD